jgi:hypothetical protein
MKRGRVLLIGGLVLAMLLLVLGGAAFSPAVQTWAARRALAGQTDFAVSLGRVSAGLQRIQLADVRLTRDGAVLTLPAAEIELPVLSAAMSDRWLVHRLVARGWTLDLTRLQVPPASPATAHRFTPPGGFSLLPVAYADTPAETAAVAVPMVFKGVFDQLKLPVDVSLDGVELAGEVWLPIVPGRPSARASLTITGGGLVAGQAGKFDYTAKVSFQGPDLAVRELTIRGTLGAVMDTPRSISRLVVSTTAEAVGPKFPEGVKLALDLSAARSASGENYALTIASGAKQLAALETSYPAGASHLGGNWRLDMRDADFAPFAFGRELPAFEAVGEGRFETDTAFAELHASGRLNARMDHLNVVNPQLSRLGSIHLTADFDFAQRGGATRVDRLAVTVEGAKPVATVQALQAFEFNLKTGELNVADPAKDLLGVVFQGLPLAWVGPLLAREGYAATGGDLQGEFVASARHGGFALRPRTPLTVDNLSLSRTEGRALVTAVDVSLAASADYTPQGWQVEFAPLTIRRQSLVLLTVEGKMGQLAGEHQAIKVAGKWSGQLPGLLAQPAVLGSAVLTAGAGQGDFAASLGDKQEIQLRLALTNLSAPAAPRLPAITVELRLDRASDGQITFSAPVRLELDDRKSDLTLAGTCLPAATGLILDARLTSEFLAVEDAQILAAPLSGPVSASAGAAGAPAAPVWAGVSGQVALAFKKVVYNGQFQITDVTGVLRLDAGAFRLVNGRGGFDADSDVRLAGGVTFHPATPQPYALAADFALNNFATAPAFRAIDPARLPSVDARINLTSKLTATGASVTDLAERARGDLLITSKGGLFRLLSADLTDRIQRTQSRVTAIASFLGVVTDDFVNKTKILSDIAKALSEIPFDQLSVTATRDATLNLQLTDFTLISPEVRIGGGGEIRHVAGVPVLAQPLTVQLNLGARGKLGDLIQRAGLLEARQDNLGYAAFAVPLHIAGTLGNPDTNDIRTALLNSALEKSGLLDGLLGK